MGGVEFGSDAVPLFLAKPIGPNLGVINGDERGPGGQRRNGLQAGLHRRERAEPGRQRSHLPQRRRAERRLRTPTSGRARTSRPTWSVSGPSIRPCSTRSRPTPVDRSRSTSPTRPSCGRWRRSQRRNQLRAGPDEDHQDPHKPGQVRATRSPPDGEHRPDRDELERRDRRSRCSDSPRAAAGTPPRSPRAPRRRRAHQGQADPRRQLHGHQPLGVKKGRVRFKIKAKKLAGPTAATTAISP